MKNFQRSLFPAVFVWLLCLASSDAGIGDDNPTGPTGEYNGSITTSGSYDPYTANAKRFVDDLTVTGSIGAYPLKWTRVLNTRGGGGWWHSYCWGLWVKPYQYYHYYDTQYEGPGAMVNYPDGRTEAFDIAHQPYTYYPSIFAGYSPDRIEHMGDGNFDLVMRDGGRVKFVHTGPLTGAAYSLIATQIVDPYGQITNLTYDGSGRLSQITEPGGRYLQVNYTTFSYIWTPSGETRYVDVISSVQAFSAPGQLMETVTYGYTHATVWYYNYYYLTQANYDDSTHATYTYTSSNTGNISSGLVQTCDDVRFAGPMKKIQYEYMPTGGPYDVSYGQIKTERNATTGQVVSQLSPVPYEPYGYTAAHFQRTETRGDGSTRLFQYSSDGHGELIGYTDFKGQPTSIAFPITAPLGQFRKSVTDARGNTTSVDRDRFSCVVRTISHPPSDNSTPSSTQQFTYTNTFYLYSTTDELNNPTYYDRDANNRVKKITYADQSTEEFTYNNFGQILTHKLRSDGWETFEYDNQPPPATRGLRTKSYPPPTPSDPNPQDHPTQYFYYTSGPSTDRLYMVIDPRGNATAYEYNLRGEVTKVQHQDGTYAQSGYNDDGTLAWTADENHPGAATDVNQRTRYTYDEYKRVLTVKNLLNETTTNYYGLDWANPLVHTTNSVKYTLSPMNKNVVFDYDANFRKIDQTAAAGTSEAATTWFEYDEVGNLTKTTDPRGNVTTFGYDNRNRKVWMDDPIASDRNSSGHTMNWEYDDVGNKKKETRADNAFRSWDYDSVNRLAHAIDWRMNMSEPAITTTYTRDVQDLTEWITDAKGAVYTFTFDKLHRKTSETYPPDVYGASRSETFKYDAVGNLILYKNPANQYKHLDYADSYDSRNRLRRSAWNTASSEATAADLSAGQEIRTEYDNASRMTQIMTNGGETSVAFGYDDANRKIQEDQTLAGYPMRRVSTPRDADGNRSDLVAPYFSVRYEYNQRNQLWHIRDGNSAPFYDFNYDASGNLTGRQALWWNGNVSNYQYDALNRVSMGEHGTNGWIFARSWYLYDNVSREVATWREEDNGMGGSRGERYSYLTDNQLTKVRYNADQVWTGDPVNWERWMDYDYTSDRLNRQSVTDNGTVTNYSASAVNQYTVNGATYNYDGNFNFAAAPNWSGAFDAQNRLMSAGHDGNVAFFTYDGLGRCVRRSVYAPSGASNTVLYTYDDWNPIIEWDQGGNFAGWNMYGARPDEILMRFDPVRGPIVYKQDQHGNVVALLDQWGNIVERYSYEAFGEPKVTGFWDNNNRGGSLYGNRFMFQGREWIAELGIYDYRNRMYQPQLGRFLQTDPMGLQTEGEKLSAGQKALFSPGGSAPEAFTSSEMNLYRYCGDDPIDGTDPTGLIFTDDIESNTHETELIDGGKTLGATLPALDVRAIRQDDGGYRLRLDVRITYRLVATKALFHGKITPRTQDQINATHTHEEQYHHDDWKGFHDSKQKEVPGTRFGTKGEAEAAAKPLEDKLKKDLRKSNEEFNKHLPNSRWDQLRRKEGI
ncbi:MAG: hypothetical protein V7609_2623 [Verrucomicrobiota bacterium]